MLKSVIRRPIEVRKVLHCAMKAMPQVWPEEWMKEHIKQLSHYAAPPNTALSLMDIPATEDYNARLIRLSRTMSAPPHDLYEIYKIAREGGIGVEMQPLKLTDEGVLVVLSLSAVSWMWGAEIAYELFDCCTALICLVSRHSSSIKGYFLAALRYDLEVKFIKGPRFTTPPHT